MFKDWDCLLAKQASSTFSPESLGDPGLVDRLRELLGPEGSVLKLAEELDLGTEAERRFLATWPDPMLEGLRALLLACVSGERQISAGFAFVAGAGYGVNISAEKSNPARLYLSLIGPEDH